MFEGIAEDATSGASALAIAAARELHDAAESFEDKDPGSFWNDLIAACTELLAAARDMAPVINLVGSVLSAGERIVLSGKTAETVLHAVQVECARVWEFGDERMRDAGENGAALMEANATVATTSNGQTVRSVLEAAAGAGKNPKVILSESRPRMEGLDLARFLGELGVPTTLVADAALPGLVDSCSMVLLGADSVSEESFVNKIGSYPLALSAREAGVPCCLVATRDKLLPSALRNDPGRPRDGAELLEKDPPNVVALNAYFEEIPNRLVRTLVTEDGPHTPAEIPEMLMERPVPPSLLQLLYPRSPREHETA